jgi:hypothetical protein
MKPIKFHRRHLLLAGGFCVAACVGVWLYNRPPYPGDVKDFPGLYLRGAMGVNQLILNANGSYRYELHTDIGRDPYAVSTGSFRISNGLIKLVPRNSVSDDFKFQPLNFYAVHWGKRRYLINTKEIDDFCDEVNIGNEPRQTKLGSYFLADGDEKLPSTTQKPAVPVSWRNYLLIKPIRTRVTRIIDPQNAVIGAGSSSGLRPGMHLFEEGSLTPLKVVSCTAHNAVVHIYAYDNHAPNIGVSVISRIN